MAHDVFISYSSKDKATADAVLAALEMRGLVCWIAPRNIVPGSDWGEAIIDAIASSRVMVLVFSAHANDSPQVKREVERAVNKGVAIVPFRIQAVPLSKSLEYFISTAHWMDAQGGSIDQHVERLAGTVDALVRAGSGGAGQLSAARTQFYGGGEGGVAGLVRKARTFFTVGHVALKVGLTVLALAIGAYILSGFRIRPGSASAAPTNARSAQPARAAKTPARNARTPKLESKVETKKEPAAGSSEPKVSMKATPKPAAPAAPDPKKAAEAAREAVRAQAKALVVESILIGPAKRYCDIDGQTLSVGEEVEGFVVEKIEPESVTVRKDGMRFRLRPSKKRTGLGDDDAGWDDPWGDEGEPREAEQGGPAGQGERKGPRIHDPEGDRPPRDERPEWEGPPPPDGPRPPPPHGKGKHKGPPPPPR